MREDIDLNLLDVLSVKHGKKAWPLNQGKRKGKRKTNAYLPITRRTRGRTGISHNLPRTSPPSTRTVRSFRQHLPLNRVRKPELWSKGSVETLTALSQETGSEELIFPQILKFKPISQILEFWLINTNGWAMNQ